MILAAGLGTRLRPVTDRYAKPAVPFLNVPLLYYPLALLEQAGIDTLVLNTHHKPEQIEALTEPLSGKSYSIAFSHESGAPLGSGGGIWKARKFLEDGGDFLVSNGDEVILPHDDDVIGKLVEKHRSEGNLATILVMHHPLVGTQFGGVWADHNGHVRGFGKDGSVFAQDGTNVKGHHYIGILILNDRIFRYLPEGESNILYDALAKGISVGEKVRVLESSFTWFETGNPKDFLHASESALALLRLGRSSGPDARFLSEFCARHWTPGTVLEVSTPATVLKGVGLHIHEEVTFEGFAVLGDGVEIKNRTHLVSSVLLPSYSIHEPGTIANEIRFEI
jgi:mannose-1-phosphate guanylyltransferase